MNIKSLYTKVLVEFIGIGTIAIVSLWLGGYILTTVLRSYDIYCYGPLSFCIEVSYKRIPYYPVASIVLLICHGIISIKHGDFMWNLKVPTSSHIMQRGGYMATFRNPYVEIAARDAVIIGLLLLINLLYAIFHGGC